jgi:hypothetical protein
MSLSTWSQAGLWLAVCSACGKAEDVLPDSLPESGVARASCEASECNTLAGPCQVGLCDAQTGACRLSAAREGEACLEGNACGPALCRSGECSALEPPPCPMADPCRIAVCRPERGGCANEPSRLPGTTCETALSLQGVGSIAASASSSCGDHTRQAPGCSSGLLGPSSHFALDLRGANTATQVAIVIDADFSFEALLARGPCGDTVLEACAGSFQADGRSRSLSVTLSPDYYELVVTGRGESDHGTVYIAASVDAASCSAPAVNDECEAGLALDASLPLQTLIGHAACSSVNIPVRCAFDAVGDVFYDLDLSSKAAATLLEVNVANIDESTSAVELAAALFSASDSGCGELAMCGTQFASRLLPGRYRIGITQALNHESAGTYSDGGFRLAPVTESPPRSAFVLRVGLRDADCAATTNDTWQSAIELDPSAERQRLAGNTACGSDDFGNACNADRGAPDLFYRLDLRGQREARNLDFSGQSDSDLVLYVLLPDAGGVPSRVAGCQALAASAVAHSYFGGSALLTLAPRLYYLVVDGRVTNAGRFDLEVHQFDIDPATTDCFRSSLLRCLDDSEPACADSRANPECLAAAVECGLDPAVYAAFCERFPGCCEGTADRAECLAAARANLECN